MYCTLIFLSSEEYFHNWIRWPCSSEGRGSGKVGCYNRWTSGVIGRTTAERFTECRNDYVQIHKITFTGSKCSEKQYQKPIWRRRMYLNVNNCFLQMFLINLQKKKKTKRIHRSDFSYKVVFQAWFVFLLFSIIENTICTQFNFLHYVQVSSNAGKDSIMKTLLGSDTGNPDFSRIV